MLARREHSASELRAKLTSRGIDTDRAEAALEQLRRTGWQDDGRFAEERARLLESRGYGSRYIFRDLCARGIAEDLARDLQERSASGDAERATRLLARRDPEAHARNRRYLEARGYPGEIIARALSQGTRS